jgi:hypothetical protein
MFQALSKYVNFFWPSIKNGTSQTWRNVIHPNAAPYTKAGESFWGHMPKLTIHVEEIISRANDNFKGKIRYWSLPQIIINYCIIIIIIITNKYYNYISNAHCNYYIFSRYAVKCGSNCGCYYFLSKMNVTPFVQCHVFAQSPPDRRPVINIQSTLRTAPDLCKYISLAVLFGRNGNSYTVSTRSDMRIQGVSRLVDITAGGDFLGLCDQIKFI